MPTYALCSPYLPEEIRREVEKLGGIPCIPIPPYEKLPKPVCHHPDMLFFNPPDRRITVLSKRYHAVNPEFFDKFSGADLLLADAELGSEYPEDIAFDAIAVSDTLYCLEAHTPAVVKRLFPKTANVKQGYAACSTLLINENTAITADSGIAKALSVGGMTVHLIAPNGIALPGYGCGFIGGASAVINGVTLFFGSLKDHPDGERIAEIYRINGLKAVDFPHHPLTDYGSIRYIYTD
jgi:hypothetical protein